MDIESIKDRLNRPMRKVEIVALADLVGANHLDTLDELMACLYLPGPAAMRAAWLVENIVLPRPQLYKECAPALVEALLHGPNRAIRRNIAKTLGESYLPKDMYDVLYDFAIKCMLSTDEAVAVKVHCMRIAFYIAKEYPDLLIEVKAVLEEQRSKNSVGFAACSKQYLKKIEKLTA